MRPDTAARTMILSGFHIQALDDYMSGTRTDPEQAADAPPRLMPLGSRFKPIFCDQEGKQHTVRSGPSGPEVVPSPYPNDPPPGLDDIPADGMGPMYRIYAQAMAAHGIFPPSRVDHSRTPTAPPAPDVPALIRDYARSLPPAVAHAWTRAAIQTTLAKGGGSSLMGMLAGSLLGAGMGFLSGAASQLAATLLQSSSGVASALTAATGGQGFVASQNAPSVLDGLTSQALSKLGGFLLDKWKVEDSDSMGEQMANHFVKKWKDKITDPDGAVKKIKGYFTGKASTAAFQVIRLGDLDAAGCPATFGFPTVTAMGMPVSRVADPVLAPGTAIVSGQAGTFAGGSLIGAAGVSASAMGPFPAGAATVLVGPPASAGGGVSPPPGVMKNFASAGSTLSLGGGLAKLAGWVWNLPNTLLGVTIFGTGHILQEIYQGLGFSDLEPEWNFQNNAIEFTNNAFGAEWGGLTLGNAILYGPNPKPDRMSPSEYMRHLADLHDHERQHTYQGMFLGPLYIPAHAFFWIVSAPAYWAGLATGTDPVHTDVNIMEHGTSAGHHLPWPGWKR